MCVWGPSAGSWSKTTGRRGLGATSCSDCRHAHEHVIHSNHQARQASKEMAWEQGEGVSKGELAGADYWRDQGVQPDCWRQVWECR